MEFAQQILEGVPKKVLLQNCIFNQTLDISHRVILWGRDQEALNQNYYLIQQSSRTLFPLPWVGITTSMIIKVFYTPSECMIHVFFGTIIRDTSRV